MMKLDAESLVDTRAVQALGSPLRVRAERRSGKSLVLALAAIALLASLLAAGATQYTDAIDREHSRCLRLPIAQQTGCLNTLTSRVSSPLSVLILGAFAAGLLVTTYAVAAATMLIGEWRRGALATRMEGRIRRLEDLYLDGAMDEARYAELRDRLRKMAEEEAPGDDSVQAGRVGRAVALYAFPVSFLPVAGLFARVFSPTATVTSTVGGAVATASGALAGNPLLSNPILEIALQPVGTLLALPGGGYSKSALFVLLWPTLLVAGALWMGVAALAAIFYLGGKRKRVSAEAAFEKEWHDLVVKAARARRSRARGAEEETMGA